MRAIILCLAATAVGSASAFQFGDRNDELCDTIDCRAGRECVVTDGIAECHCINQCPDRYAPVCGSDHNTYDTHCQLHRHACLTGEHISVEHKGMCKKTMKAKAITTPKPKVNKQDPAVCYGAQRDALLTVIRQHWQDTLSTQPWHVSGMTYREGIWGRFYSCDTERDSYMAAHELLNCTSDVPFNARPEQEQELTRALCVDALVDVADTNRDWRLDFEEFTKLFSPGFHPPQKKCSLEGKKYQDGEDVSVDGSHCICAVGSWVCSSPSPKDDKNQNDFDVLAFNALDDYDEDDYDLEDEQFLIDEDEDEDYMEDLFEDMLDKMREHRRKNSSIIIIFKFWLEKQVLSAGVGL